MDRRSFFALAVKLLISHSYRIQGIDQEPGNYQSSKHGDHNTKGKSLGKTFDGTCTQPVQNESCDQSSDISIKDSGKGFVKTIFQRCPHASSCRDLLLDTGVDDNVGIHSHTNRKNDTCNTL